MNKLLENKPSVTRDDILSHLDENRVGLRENQYTPGGFHDGESPKRQFAKWQSYSLDPENPTYKETVLHLPEKPLSWEQYRGNFENQGIPQNELRGMYETYLSRGDYRHPFAADAFQSGHFPEPNIVGHMQTSLNRLPLESTHPLEDIGNRIAKAAPIDTRMGRS